MEPKTTIFTGQQIAEADFHMYTRRKKHHLSLELNSSLLVLIKSWQILLSLCCLWVKKYTEKEASPLSSALFANVQLHCQQELKLAYHLLNNDYSLTFSSIHHFGAGVTFFLAILTQGFGFIMQTNSTLKYVLSFGSLICISDRSLLYCVSRDERNSVSCCACFITSSFSSLFSENENVTLPKFSRSKSRLYSYLNRTITYVSFKSKTTVSL